MDLIFLPSQARFVQLEISSCVLMQMKTLPAKLTMNIKELHRQYCPKDIFLYVFSCVFVISSVFTKGRDNFHPLWSIFGFVGSNSRNALLIPRSEWGQSLVKSEEKLLKSYFCGSYLNHTHFIVVTPALCFSIFPFYPWLAQTSEWKPK